MRFTRPSVSTVCNAATPVLGIAREATDGLGIAGQVFAVVSQIATLAQKIDKQRDSLRELVKKSRELATAIARAVGNRTPPEHLNPTLTRTLSTLQEVQDFMTSYTKKSRFKRFLSHLTSVPEEIERLKLALTDVLEELQMVAALDTNLRAVSTEAKIDDNMRWEGPIRRLHDGLMDKGPLLFTQPLLEHGPLVKFHSANVKTTEESAGKVLIVRFVDKPSIPSGDGRDVVAKIMNEYDEMMKELSKTSTKHRHVLTIYGRTSGDPLDRTTALDLDPVLISGTTFVQERKETNTSSGIALKLMDAAAHLNRHGIDWVPQNKEVRVNQHGEPIIGLDMDLRKRVAEKAGEVYQTQMDTIFILYEKLPTWEIREQIKEVRYRLAMGLPSMTRNNPTDAPSARSLSQMLATLTRARKVSIVIPKSDFLTYLDLPNLRLNGNDDYLAKVTTVLGKPAPFQPSIWARIMTLLAKGSDCTEFRADYCPSDDGDKFVVIWLDAGRSTNVWLHMYHVDIPDSRRDAARKAFNIPTPPDTHSPSIRLL